MPSFLAAITWSVSAPERAVSSGEGFSVAGQQEKQAKRAGQIGWATQQGNPRIGGLLLVDTLQLRIENRPKGTTRKAPHTHTCSGWLKTKEPTPRKGTTTDPIVGLGLVTPVKKPLRIYGQCDNDMTQLKLLPNRHNRVFLKCLKP